ncbi:MAG: DNA-deoxyinosine glycosylase [Verrucomicrobia bacterium]|nr:DNA-deoxyinosine glycosylase [Verrucomicrobiota bacterium]
MNIELQQGFSPIVRRDARILILGSMPGEESLRRRQYYAYPQNAFWEIMSEIAGTSRDLPYHERLRKLKESRIALWDVCRRCHRPGSLDSSIRQDTVEPNDFASLFAKCRSIDAIFFNGHKPEDLFRKLVFSDMPERIQQLPMRRLPSTSPANAGMSRADKLKAWREIEQHLQC